MEFKSIRSAWLALLFVLCSFASAQTSTTVSSSASTAAASSTTTTSASAAANSASTSATSSGPITHTVSAGYAGFTFSPDAVLANVGDTIEFDFYPTNHSVVRAEYGYPCVPYEDTGVDKVGFFSGFMPVDEILSDPPKWSIKVNDTEPIFFYCSAPGSCISYGMVGAINPNATETVARQQQLAKEATFMLQPGEPWPSESTPEPGSSSSAAASSSAATTAVSTSHHSSGLSGGAIAGIVIGIVAVLTLFGAVFFLCGRNRALSDLMKHRHRGDHDSEGRGSALAGSYHAQPKHVSGMTMMQRPDGELFQPGSVHTSPHLPQYGHMYSDEQSPSLRAGSDMFSPTSPQMPRSPSPRDVHGNAPAYSALPPELYQEPPKGPHELYVPDQVPATDPPKKNPGADHYA